MARPKKTTVDYFPHTTEHGSTMFILESRWGNDGYAAWFKILERLGCSDGLFIDCNSVATWQYLCAYTKISSETLAEILETLAQLDAIDQELWQRRIIYCQKLVDGVTDAFRLRRAFVPTREKVFVHINSLYGSKCDINGVFDDINGESERESERKEKVSTEGLGFPSLENKSLYACGKVDNSPENGDNVLLEAQRRLVDKRSELGIRDSVPGKPERRFEVEKPEPVLGDQGPVKAEIFPFKKPDAGVG